MDNLLIYLVQSYNLEALNILVEKYRKIISIWINEEIRKYKISLNFDKEIIYDDLELMLYQIIENYNPSKGVFYTYLKGAVTNMMMNHIRCYQRKNINMISLNQTSIDEIVLEDLLPSSSNLSRITERYNLLEEIDDLKNKLNRFNDDDRLIIYLKMQGFTNDEIEKMTDTNIRQVNYILRKIKK